MLGAASVVGIGDEDRLPNWNATPAALLESCKAFNDQIMPLNELGLLKGKAEDIAAQIARVDIRLRRGPR